MSSFSIKTDVLQSLTNRIIRGAGKTKFNPLTNLVSVVVKDNKMSLTTTDSDTWFTLTSPIESGDDLSFTVDVDMFCKVIGKTTVDTVKITVDDDVVTMHGNGTYKIGVMLDVDGQPVKFPEHTLNTPKCEGVIKTEVIRDIILHNKASLSLDEAIPSIKNYMCMDDAVYTANGIAITRNGVKTFGEDTLVAPTAFELLTLCGDDEVQFKMSDSNILFTTDTMTLFTVVKEGLADYPVDICVENTTTLDYPSNCTLSKSQMLNVIDRLSLFIKDTDVNGLLLSFTETSVKVETFNHKGVESVQYQGSNNFADYTCAVDIDEFKREVASRAGESFNLYYGNERAIAIKEDNVTQVLALISEDK